MMLDQVITASIVLFHNKKEDLQKVIESFLGHKGNVNLILVDNSSNDELSSLANDPRINYIFNNSNLGFGKAHNIALNSIQNRVC